MFTYTAGWPQLFFYAGSDWSCKGDKIFLLNCCVYSSGLLESHC
jgi:hypothetical protein